MCMVVRYWQYGTSIEQVISMLLNLTQGEIIAWDVRTQLREDCSPCVGEVVRLPLRPRLREDARDNEQDKASHMCAHASTSRSLSLLSSGQKGGAGSVAARDGDVQGGDLKVLAVVVCNLDTHANLKVSGEDVVRKGKVIDFRAHFGDLEVTKRRGRGETMAERTVEGWRRRWRRERSRGERKEGEASEEGGANALPSREERTLT